MRPGGKQLTVFLCSTQSDLRPEREAILDAVRRLQLHHDSMEFFGARERAPIETCLDEVRRSDILVMVVGHRYGTFVPGMEVSYTEAEYQEGYRLGKPCLVYIREDDTPVLPRHVEQDPKSIQFLLRLKQVLRQRHTVASFKMPNDLAVGVAADLSRIVQDLKEAERHKETSPPSPSRPVLQEIAELAKAVMDAGVSEGVLLKEIRRSLERVKATASGRQPVVFVSHTDSDKPRVRPFAEALNSRGIQTWIDEERIAAGQSLIETISKGLQSADCLAFFVSQSSVNSAWVRRELGIVMAERLSSRGRAPIVIPILLDDVELPPFLRDVKYIDFRSGDVQKAADEFARSIAQHLAAPPPTRWLGENRHVMEKAIHALRGMLYVRYAYRSNGLGQDFDKKALDYVINDLACTVGGLCGLPTKPENRLNAFVHQVLAAEKGNDLPVIFRETPELTQYLKMPYFDMGDGATSWVTWD